MKKKKGKTVKLLHDQFIIKSLQTNCKILNKILKIKNLKP